MLILVTVIFPIASRIISIDGKWRSFPKVPNLLQYVIAGTYYARCKVDGKPVRSSLETVVISVAKVRLQDKLKESLEMVSALPIVVMAHAPPSVP